jgi:hypothetical protein
MVVGMRLVRFVLLETGCVSRGVGKIVFQKAVSG